MVGNPGFIFSTTGQGAPTYDELLKRREILAHLLAQKRGPPKNIGEGLTALGEGFGDLMYGLQTRGAEQANADYGAKAGAMPAPPPAAAPYEYKPPAAEPPATTPPPAAPAAGPAAAVETDPNVSSADVNVNPDLTAEEIDAARTPAEKMAADASKRADALIQPQPSAPPPAAPPPAAAPAPGPQSSAAPPAGGGPLDYIASRGGHASVLQDGNIVHVHPSTTGRYGAVNPEFAARLAAAGQAYEQETGQKAKYGEMSRGEDVQTIYYNKYLAGTGGIAARPGHSSHQSGEATDLPTSGFRQWLNAGNMERFGLHFPVKGDAPHITMNSKYAGPAFSSGDTQVASGPQRDRIATTLTGQTPLTADDRAQEAILADVTGSSGPGPSDFSYPQTASRGDITSDLPEPGISSLTGGPGAAVGGNIADTAQARRDAITRTLAPPPPQQQPGAPTAQAGVSSDAPPVGVPQILPRSQLVQPEGATAIPRQQPLPPKPPPPEMVQPDPGYVANLSRIANDPRLDPARRKQAYDTLNDYRLQVQHENDKRAATHQTYLNKWLEEDAKRRDYGTQLDNEKKVRELRDRGFYQATPEQAAKLFPGGRVPEGQALWFDANGKPVLGPVGTTVKIDQRQQGAEEGERGTLAAKAERGLIDTATKAGNELYNVRRAQVTLDQIRTGALQPGTMKIGALAKDLGIPAPMLESLGLNPKEIANQQVFEMLSNRSVLGMLGDGGMPTNNFSNTDRTFVQTTVSALGDDPASNKIKLEIIAKDKERQVQKLDEWSDFRADPKNQTKDGRPPSFTDFEFQWNRKVRNSDALGHLYKEAQDLVARGNAARGEKPALPQPPADLPPNAPIGKTFSDGNETWRRTNNGWERVQ